VEYLEVGGANGRGFDFDDNLPRLGLWLGHLGKFIFVRLGEDDSEHGFTR
jgi:hypothetical protein